MKKPTILKIALLLLLFLQADIVFSQKTYKGFVREYNKQLKGDIITIGNSILNRGTKNNKGVYTVNPNTPYDVFDTNVTNGSFDMYYVNVDPTPNSTTTFSSSSATLTVPNNIAPAAPCYRVAYAALYWSGILRSPADRTKITNVKIKVPNTTVSGYQDVVGNLIYDIDKNADGIPDSGGNKTQAYACWAEVTSLLSETNPNGLYTVANVVATEGVKNTNGSTGLAAGWSLFVIYEDNSLPTKSISSFNGFAGIGSNATVPLTTNISGFTTPALGDVNARVAFAALEGDYGYSGDYLKINNKSITTTPASVRPATNFFNSTITTTTGPFLDRNPASKNTLGFDAGVLDILPSSGIIQNKATSADIMLGTNLDVYIVYFMAFSVDVIAPNIKLIKTVQDADNNDAANANVTLGQELRYTLDFKNEGNDSATQFTITDQLPVNTNFNFPTDIFKLPTGMTVANNVTYNSTTRTITFNIPKELVEKTDPWEQIRFKVHVVDDCASLTDACSNIIKNSAMSSYRGNPAVGGGGDGTLFGDTSYAVANSCTAIPQSTNFLVGLDACKNRKAEICLSEMEISASGGYGTYKWSSSPTYSPVLGTGQKLKVTGPGKYYVFDTAKPGSDCKDLEEIIEVVDGGGVKTNPIITYADNKETTGPFAGTIIGCPVDGKPLPKIFLCGANDSRLFNLNLPLATIVWEKTDCVRPPVAELSELCADERSACQWVSAGDDGSLFTAKDAGYYRVTISSSGGCVNRYYFNVYKSDVAIHETHKNILCNNPGSITVDQLTGYEYSLTHVLIPASSSTTTAYTNNNVFSITTAGNYIVNYRLKNVNPTCAYKTNQIIIDKDDFTAKVENPTENPFCYGDKARLVVSATSGFTDYYYTLYQDGVKVQELGPLPDRSHAFELLDPGKTYLVEVFTKNADQSIQCLASAGRDIPNVASELKLTSTILLPRTACEDGKYLITATGGNGGYSFFVDGDTTAYATDENGNTDPNSIIILTPTAKEYTILVRDSKTCTTTYKFTVPDSTKPAYTIETTPADCYGGTGKIEVKLTNGDYGYTMGYSIDNGAFQPSPIFLGVAGGSHTIVVQYGLTYTIPNQPSGVRYCQDPAQSVNVSGPTTALTASAGVAELSGCGPAGHIDQGKIRITNAQGGTPGYQYSFDGQVTWSTLNEAYVDPGTYTVYVKDSKGCIYSMSNIILEQKPEDPTIKIEDVVYNCDGTGKTTATVTNNGGSNYSYEYYIDNKPNTPITNNVFNDVLSGTHTVKVKYKLEDAATYSSLLKEDFGSGAPTTSPGIATAYCFNDQRVTSPYVCGTRSVEDNQYSVASFFWRNDTAWFPFKDHTTNGVDPNGRYLLVNIGGAAGLDGILYSKPIADVIPNQPVKVDLAVANLLNVGQGGGAPIVRFELVNPAGVVVASVDTGKIAEDPNDPNRTKWVEIPTISLNPGPNTNLTFVIRSGSTVYGGNDLLIDDISVYQLPKSCLVEREFDFEVGTNKAFNVLEPTIQNVACSGGNTGSITITAENFDTTNGFYYSVDNGGTWNTSTVSPVIIGGLTAKSYTVIVQSDATGTCSKSFTKTIGSGTPVTVTASVTKPLTCSAKATITAVADGGSIPYKYELREADGITAVVPFQDSAVFPNVIKGSYTVVAKDINNCPSGASIVVIVDDPTPPTAKLDTSSDLCFDAVNKASIVVTATGTGTLSYSLDNAPAVGTNVFNNVSAGTHNVVVTDSNGCKATVSNIIVSPEIKGKAKVTQTLNCNTAGATIKVDITSGTGPFTYKVKEGSNLYGSSNPVTGSTFNYTAPGAGFYTFEISDANSPTACKAEITATVNSITKPSVDATPVQVACFGGSTGEVTLTGHDGSLSYTYSFNNSLFTTTTKYTGLKAGIPYPYQVKDSNGCTSDEGSITLTQPTAVDGTISATDIKCNGTGTTPGIVTIEGKGGTGTYTYSFNGNTNYTGTNTFPTSVAATVTAYVKDSNGCEAGPFSISVGALQTITSINLDDKGYDCSTTPQGGHVIITAVKAGSLANVSYQIIAGPTGYNAASNTTGDFQPLAPGIYTFQATDSKTNCSKTIVYEVKGTSDIVAGGSITTTIKCNAGTGNIQFTVTGVKTSGYDYVVKNAANATIQQATNVPASTTTIVVTSAVPAGDYTITVTDRLTKCSDDYTINLVQPANPLDVTATAPNVNCNKYTVFITAAGKDGTPSYTYAVVEHNATAPTVFAADPKLSVNTVNGTKLSWDVYVKDANGCTDFVVLDIIKDAVPTVTATLDNQCTGSGNKFRITAHGTGGIGTLEYGINGVNGAFSTNNVFDVAASATPYTVWVRDANLCPASATPITVYSQLTATKVVKELDCSPTKDATITITANGGKTPYKYEVSTDSGTIYNPMLTNVFTTSTSGTFLIKITDGNNCTFVESTTILSIADPTVTVVTQANVKCNGGSDGSVKLIGHGGSGGYNYSSDATTGFSIVDTFSGLAAGDHTFYVKDSKGCTGSIIVTITEPQKLVTTASAPAFTCNTTNVKQSTTVTIAIPTTGTGPYEYSFNSGAYSTTVRTLVVNDNGTDQTINFSVRDKNLCVFSDSVILSKLNPPAIFSVTPSVVTCLDVTSTAVVNMTAGTGVGALEYETIAPSPIIRGKQSSNSFANLTPGDYIFKVTDASGCYDTESITIKSVTNITVNGITNNDAKCKGTSTGNGTYTVSNIATVGDYAFLLTAGNLGSGTLTKLNNTLSLNNVPAGSYTVKVTDNATGCFSSATIVIAQPADDIDVTAVATKINCNNDVAIITAAGAGGTAPYKYAVVEHNATAPTTIAGNAILNVDTAGGTKMNWDVYVQDANGCTDFVAVSIDTDPTPTVTATLDNQCTASGSNFRITATGLNGVAPLKYGINGINGTFGTLNTFDVPARATPYIVWVKDANGCTAQAAAIMVYPQLTALAKVTKTLDCSPSPKAQITVDINGGKSTYTYKVDSGSGYGASVPVTGNQFVYTDAATAGIYKFEITDSNSPGCKIEASATVIAISNPTVAIVNQVNITCFGADNGSVKLKGSGGSGSGYTYSNKATTGFSIVDTFNGLTPGLHTFYVRDGKECPTSIDVTILEPSALITTASAAPFSCNTTTNAKQSTTVTIVPPTTGTGPYEYSFNGTSYDALIKTLTVNDNGSDQVIPFYVRDKNLCVYNSTVTIAKLNPPVIFSVVPTPVTCTDLKSTVTVTKTPLTGVGNLVYSITAPAAYATTNTDGIFANLDPNTTYTFKVVDENGCFDTETLKVNAVTPILVSPSKLSDVKCKGDATGVAKYTISQFSATTNYDVTVTTVPAALSYTLTQVGDVITLSNLKAGDYTLSVVDKTTHCPADATITINEPVRVLAASYVTVNANCKIGTSKVTITAVDGTSPYKYSYVQNNAGIGALTNVASANLDPNVNTDWDVYVVDANGCQVKLDVTIAKDDVPTITATAAGQCLGSGAYTITASGTGTGTLQYSLDDKSYQLGNTFVVTTAGTYNVWVKDANGCTAKTATPITVLDQLTISAKLDKNITCVPGSEDAKITLTVAGGSGSYAYSYTSVPATAVGTFAGNVFTTSDAADFIFTVTDTSTLPVADRCKATTTVPIHITTPVPPHFTFTEGPKINCNGDESGSLNIVIDPALGQAPFVIDVHNDDIPKDFFTQTSGLPAGNYTITVTDAKGCTFQETYEIEDPDPIVVDYDTTPMQCVGAGVSKGEIIIKSVTGGTANYDYYVTGINGYSKEVHGIPGTTVVFEVVDFGLYQIRVVDKNGCSNIISDVLIAAPVDELGVVINTTATCAPGGGSATITIKTAFAGNGPYHFNIYRGKTPAQIWTADGVDGWQGETSAKESIYNGLTPGVTYTFIIYDEDTKCYYYQVAPTPVPTNSKLKVVGEVINNVTCTGSKDGSFTFAIQNNYPVVPPTPPSTVNVSFQVYEALTNLPVSIVPPLAITTATITDGTTSANINVGPLPVGSYYVLVKETSGPNVGCSVVSTNFNIKESAIKVSLTASATSIADCTNLGTISAQAKDGTGPYKYIVLPSPSTKPAANDIAWDSVNTFKKAGSVAGIVYDVYAKDAYNCIVNVPVTVFKYKDPTIAPIAPICYDGTPFKITIAGTVDSAIVGGATYSVDGSTYDASPEFTFNAAGTYHLFIKDGKGCTATIDYDVKPALKLDAVLTKDLDCSVTDANSSKAIITLTASGGYGTTYGYEFSTNGGTSWTPMTPTLQADGVTILPDNVLQTNVPANYIFRATDKGNTTTCQVTKAFTLDPIPAIVFTVAETNITCPGGSDGTITVDVTAGVGPFEYKLEKGGAVIVNFNSSNEFKGLADGNDYVVTVRDAKLCFATENAAITIPDPLIATAVLTKGLTCNTDNSPINAEVTVTVTSGGTTPYQYSFDGGLHFSNDNKYTTSIAAPVTVIVKDGNGCETTLPVVPVPALNPPSAMDISGTPIYCLPSTSQQSTVTINSVTGGVFDLTHPLQYEILSPIVVAKQTSKVFANLDPSTEPYVFQVTDMNGCTFRDSFKVDPVVSITVSSQLDKNVSCIGFNDGSVKFTVANHGAHTYTAILTTGAGTLTKAGDIVTATDLIAGTYVLQVTDDITKCTSSASMVVSEPSALNLVANLSLFVNGNCTDDAFVSVTASGGTAPYQYSFVPKGSPAGTYAADSEVYLDPATADWDVWVKDAHSCVIAAPLTISVLKDPSPTVAMPAPICFEGSPVNIDLSIGQTFGPGLGPVTYKINNATQSSATYAITAPGFYDISIIDINGCESNVVSYEVKPQLELDAKVTRDLSCIVGSEDAQFELTASNGHGSYTYSYTLDGGPIVPMTLNTLTNGASGTYVFTVTDAQNCTANYTIVLDPITPIAFTVAETAVSCKGDSTGTISVNVTSGNAPYEYQLEDGATIITGYQPLPQFTGLPAKNTYVVRVRDAKMCDTTMPAIITQPVDDLTATSDITTKLICTPGNLPSLAVVTITPAGGTSPYQYSYDGGVNYSGDNTYETTTGITFDVYVKDKNGCIFPFPNGVNVPALTPPTGFGFDLVQAFTCAQKATVDVVSVLGGKLPLQYETLSPSPVILGKQNSATFTDLTPGFYVFQVTDDNGCTHQESFTVPNVINITVAGSLVKNASCKGLSDGSIKFTVENKAGGYTATLSPNVGTLTQVGDVVTVTNLPVGTYTLNVTDAITQCVNSATVEVEEPETLDISLVSQKAGNCYFGAIVTVKATGGKGLYKFAFVHAGATPIASDYTPDDTAILDPAIPNWDVYVQDENLICSDVLNVTITKDDAPTINVNANIYCYTGGPVPITITGTTDSDIVDPPMYSIGNGYYASPNFTLNAPGSYEFFIKDGNGCVAKATYVLRQELLIDAILTQDLNCTTNDATITLSASQGTGAGTYSFEYDLNNSGTFTAVPALPYHPTAPGTYTFRVKDGQCSTVSVPVIVTPKTDPKFATDLVQVLCKNDSNGSITVNAYDGVAPYEYSITDGVTTWPFQASNLFTGLKANTYTVSVRDAKKCPATSAPVTITEPTVLTATHAVTPFGCDPANTAKDAVLTLTAHDGTSPYSYSFDNGVTFGNSPSHTMNTAATVNYVIVDFNGCRATGTANVPVYNPPTHFDLTATPIYCSNVAGTATVTVSLVITGGEAPYTYAIIEPAASATSNTIGSFANLSPATYVIKVTDANGCSTVNSIEVKKASEISVEAQSLSDVLCNGGTTGSIAFTISNYITPANYVFALSPNNGTFTQSGDVVTYTGLTAASYTFTVTDNTSGCTDNVANFLVSQPIAPLSFTMAATNISCNNKNATITVNATGGTKDYSYAAVVAGQAAPTTFSTDNKIVVDTNNGTAWDVYVKDFNGCTTLVQTQNILTDALPGAITANVTSQCPSATGTYEIVVAATGKAPLEYSIGSGFQSNPSFQVNSSGSYDVTVKDGNGCTVTVTAAVVISGALDLQLDIQALPSCDAPDGRIVAKATGGSGNYRYSSGAYVPVTGATATFNNVSAGSHTVTVTDLTTGCKDVVTVELKEATQITGLALDKTDVTCNGGSNGRIIVNLAPNAPGVNDNPIYKYTLTGTAIGNVPVSVGPQDSNVFDNLLPGDYTVKVTSGRNCNAQVDTRIIQPTPIVVNAPTIVPFGCTTGTNTTNFASITVNSVTGGTSPYKLYVFSKNGTVVQSSDSNVYNETDLKGGSYSVKVFDSKGCEGSSTAPILIAPFITMNDVNVAVVTPITCTNNETIQVSVATTGGTPTALVYTLTGVNGTVFNQTNPTGLFSGLAIGNYAITVFNPTTGCTIKDFHYVFDPNTFTIKVATVKGEVCYGDSDGSVNLTFVDNQLDPSNDAGIFTYVITGPVPGSGTSLDAGPVTIAGLKAGQYTVTARLVNKPECTVTNVFTINQPGTALLLDKSVSPITCVSGNNDGVIAVAASGGWDTNYQYELVGPVNVAYSTQNEFKGLTAGNYTINVKDGKGCIATTTATLVNPAPIVVNALPNTTMLSCHGDKSAVITVAPPTGGQGSNYKYTLYTISDTPISTAGPQSTGVFSGLGAGTYTVIVTDGFSCEGTSAQIVISEPTIVEGSLIQSKITTCQTQAQLTLSAKGGTGPYTYSTDGVTVQGTFVNSITFDVAPGSYKYYVADVNGCVGFVTNSIDVAPMIPLKVNLDVSSAIVRCQGDATAILIATAEGGLGDYIYTLYSGTTGTNIVRPAQNNGTFSDLPVGFYRVSVKSGVDCSKESEAFEITEPKTPFKPEFTQTNVTCFGESNGKMVVTATGGTGSYKYSISPDSDQFDTKNVFENLAVGDYVVIAMDENGCNEVHNFTITQPTVLKATELVGSMIPEYCAGDNDGVIFVEVTEFSGTAPYKASIDNEDGPFIDPNIDPLTFSFTGLKGGHHDIYIKDANGCTIVISSDSMPEPVTLNPVATLDYDCVDDHNSNAITVKVDSSVDPARYPNIKYTLDGTGLVQTGNPVFRDVAPGEHFVLVELDGCPKESNRVTVVAVDPLALVLSEEKGVWNVITATASGGGGQYQYSIDGVNFSSENKFTIYKSGVYTITVIDKNGCKVSKDYDITYVDVCIPNYFTPAGQNNTWAPGCTNIYTNLIFSIFDRYGREIAKYHYGQSWDGRYNGEELPSGDYWYVLKLNDEKDAREFVGHFTLYR